MQHKFTPTTHLKRAALTLLALIMTCATAWADNDPVSYIAANGSTQTCTDYTVLHTGDNVSNLPGGWYVVSENVEFNSQLYFSGSASIILCDGKTLTVNSGNYNSINVNYALTIYGQSGQSGTLNATCNSGTNSPCIYARNDITINGGIVSVNGEIGIRGPVITINRGTVTSTGNLSGIWATNNVIINGGKVRATGDSYGVMANNNITLGWTNYSDFINANSYYAVDGSVAIATGKTLYDDATAYSGTLTSDQIQAIVGQTLCPYSTNDFTVNTDSTEYTIHTATGWDVFCDALQDNNTWNHFSGKTVKLGADISITQSAGSAGNEFMGTFDGDGKTLTVDITETTTQGTAPFREIKGATIQNLVVTGSVIGTIHAAGLVGFARGADASTVNTITNCKVATNVTVTTPSGNNYHCGGVVGHAFHCTLNMSNTVYCGDITNSGSYVGGLQGWSDGNTIIFSHCLFAGSYSGTTTGTALFHPVAVRYNNSATTANVSYVYYTVTPTLTNSSFIAADGTKTISRATTPATIGDQTQSLNFMSTTIYQNGICYNNLYYATIGLPSGGTDIYLIDNADDWLYFCEMLNDNATWNRFSGKTVKLGANITVTQMAGGSNHAFTGTFDGNHKTLTLNYGTVQAPIDAEFVAPFVEVSGGAEFINLNIDGHIYAAYTGSSDPGVGGLIGHLFGGITIEGCTSTVEINSTKDRVGGFVGLCEQAVTFTNCKSSAVVTCTGSGSGFVGWSRDSNYTIAFYGCLFNGKVLKKNGVGSGNGGFVGWKGYHKTVEITNCLVDPAAVAEGETMADDNSATFCRFSADTSLDNQATTITNCYYTETFGNAQGTQAHSITAGEYVTLANAGTVSNNYTTSGLIFYNVGLKYGDVLYAAANDEVSLTLAHQDREGYDFIGYTATAGNLNGSSLTMPDGNVTINAEYTYTAPSELTATDITFTTATLNWNGLQENYSVRYRTVGANEWQTIDNIAATTTTLSGLLSGTTYEWQVQGLDCDGNGGTTEWSATATFTTLSTCEVQPSELTATDITTTTATLNWNGLQESYSVRYHPVNVILNEGFESGTDGWTRTGSSQNVNYQWQVTSGTGYDGYTGAATGNYNAGCFIGNYNDSDILITPVMDLSNVVSATLSFNFLNTDWGGDINILKVYYRVDEGEWHLLYDNSDETGGWIPVTVTLEGMAAHYQIGFECEGHYSYGMGIDDVKVTGINTSEWTTVTNVSSPHDLTGLTPGTPYVWQVQGLDCDGEGSTTGWSEAGYSTTPNPCEAPSELTATDITFTTATLNWNGLQESYSVRYRTVGANEWQTIDNIAATTTTLSGLLSGTTYEWQVQGLDCDGEGSTTEWSESGTFTTPNPCEVAPYELTATDITATTATLNWNGLQESYNVRCHPVNVILNEGFESGTMPDGWTRTGAYWQVTSGPGYSLFTGSPTGNYNAACYINEYFVSDTLITPVMDLSNVASATLSFNFLNTYNLDEGINSLYVYYRVDEGEWHWLYDNSDETEGWIPVTINLEGMAANYQIGFECESHWSYGMGIDDVKVIDNGAWTTENNVLNPFTLTGLTPETQYVWQVQGLDCDGNGGTTEWSATATFTTLSTCEVQPSELAATDITFTTATLNWNGLQESYSVRYRTVGANEWQTIDNIAAATTTLSGLLSETTYEWQVQGLDCNSEGSTTEWSEAGTFTTPNPCEAPFELTATDITATTATLNWNGLQESYSVRYLPVILYEGFESGTMPDGWTRTNEYWEVTSGTGHLFHKGAATGNYNAGCYTSYSNDSDILITPVMDLGNVASAILSFNFWNTNWDGDINILKVHYRVNGGEWHLLYTNSNETGGWIPVTINLQGMAANYQIGFECEGHYSYGMGIDDVMVTGINTSEWTTVTNVSSPHNLTGLTPETQYLWQVQGLDCNGEGSTTEWSEAGIFTTLLLPLPVNYVDVNGETQQCTNYIWLTGTETTLGAEGQETWCVVHSTLNYSQGIQLLGNTHIILCDGAAMNIGSSASPVSGSSFQEQVGFYGDGNNLSLYAQSGNTGALTIYSQSCSFFVKDLTIAGGNVNATSLSDVPVIFCDNLTVRRSSLEVHANYYAAIQANNDVTLSNVTANLNSSNAVGLICSNFAVDNSQLTVNARYQAIEASNVITLSNVTANINSSNGSGLVCSNFAVDHSQLTVTALYQAIQASNVITLGCTAATDFIKATCTSSLTGSYSGTVKIADGQTLYAGTNAYTGTLTDAERQAIGGQKLTNVAPPTYDYIGLDGTGATHTAVVIDADNMPTSLSGWYIVQGTVNYTNTINLGGDTHIILADNAVMNVTASEGNYGIQSTSGNNYSLFVYGQTGQSGELNVTSNSIACFISGGDITIAGGKVTASGRIIGLYAQYTNNNGGNVTIKNATVTATGTSYFGILSEYGGNITIDNSNVTATSTGSSGIYAGNGNITIDNSNVTATSTGSSGIYAENGNITIASGTVTASGSSTQFGIYTVYGSVTINGGQVTTTGSIGIYTVYGSVTINGGQVMATGNIYGIYAQNSSDNITLGWTNPTDYIYVNKYYAGGTLSIAEGKTFIDEAGQTYSGTIAQVDGAYAIDGKTLYPYNENAVPYLDENGQQRYCVAYTTLTGTETTLGAAGQETWYVVDSDVSFTDLTINGDIHLILVDGKTMNLNHEQGFVTLWGQANLTIYGQTNGTGTLSSLGTIGAMNITGNGGIVNVKGTVFFKEDNFIPAIWCEGMVINGGKVYAQGDMGIVVASMGAKSDDMTTYNFTLNGGQVTAIGMSTDMGIIATGNITLGWTNPTDYIYANSYYAEDILSIASGKTFIDDDGNPYSGIIAQVAGAYAIDGKTLYPDCVVMKQVAGYEEGNGGWVFIASPVAGSIAPSEVHNLFPSADETTDDYDLYHFNQAAELEWENWKAEGTGNDPDFTTLVNGQGYLYATKNTKTLVFTGPFITDAESVAVGLEYDATDDHKCWNLVGNPFADTAYVDHDFYVMNALGSEIIAAEREYVNPMEGIFVKAEGEYDDTMTFSLQAPCKGQSSKPKHEQMVINLSRDRGPSTLRVASGTAGSGTTIIDRAIVRMGEGQTQPKFQINRNSTKLYIPQGGTDYAIITSNGQGELPLNFKAETDGTYTLSFNAEEVSFSYLHLIDNMTGADVDLLPLLREQGGLNQPATYTFTAKTTDYESRFKLVFSTNDTGDTSTGLETEGSGSDDVRTQKMVNE